MTRHDVGKVAARRTPSLFGRKSENSRVEASPRREGVVISSQVLGNFRKPWSVDRLRGQAANTREGPVDERSGGRLHTAVVAIGQPRRAEDWGRTVCTACRDALDGVDSVGLVLHSTGFLVDLVGCSDSLAEQAEDAQIVVGEGPGPSAYSTGTVVRATAGSDAFEPWPMLAHEAARLGVGAVIALPLRVGGLRIGRLDLYRRQPGGLSTEVETDAMLLAELISYTLIEDFALREPGADPLATTHRDVNIATGMIAAQRGISLEEAFLRLRAFAFAAERSLPEVARGVLERRVDLDGATE
ncbi:ANTAR domain-containing protein [Nocardia sp. NPDC052254]|uniref:GAF and ANTAR domain-containing protein n=1 Tax=Nocardia sp. NPDC052254 TaxID=3155681 RepID=UPI0034404205